MTKSAVCAVGLLTVVSCSGNTMKPVEPAPMVTASSAPPPAVAPSAARRQVTVPNAINHAIDVARLFDLDSEATRRGTKPSTITPDALATFIEAPTAGTTGGAPHAAPPTNDKLTATQLLTAFFAESKVCSLPEKLAKKLKKKSDDPFLPAAVKPAIKDISALPGTLYAGQSIATVLHSAKLKNGATLDFQGAGTTATLDLQNLTYKGRNNLYYNVDCSGYFRASAEAKAGAGGVNVDANLAAKWNQSASMLALVATVASPVAYALAPEHFAGIGGLRRDERLAVLIAILAAAGGAGDSESIEAPLSFRIVGTATQSTQNLQGSVDASGSAAGGVGFASASISASSGFSISSSISYGLFDTLVLPPTESGVVTATLGDVRATTLGLVQASRIGLDTVEGRQVLRADLPVGVCRLGWQLATLTGSAPTPGDYGSVSTDPQSNGCSFRLGLTKAGTDALTAKTLVLYVRALNLWLRVAE